MIDLSALTSTIRVADGAWGVELASGADVVAELANLERPEDVVALGRAYVAAGAEVLSTNTFAANRAMFERRGVDADAREVCRRGAELARVAVRGTGVAVAGVIGPSGGILAVGERRAGDLGEVFREAAEGLVAGGADLLVLETFTELAEATAALEAVRAAGASVVASMSFASGPQRMQTVMGDFAGDCARALAAAGADMVGCNCGAGAALALPAVVAMRAATNLPLWVKPSVGLPDLVDGRAVYPQTPEEFAAGVSPLIDAGATIVGGCCGAGPEHVRRLAALVRRARK